MPFPNPATQFRPGQSGNPAGRPKSKPIMERLAEALDSLDGEGKTIAEKITQKWIDLCLEGDVPALKELLVRLYGKPKDNVHLEHDPLTIRVVYDDEFEPRASGRPQIILEDSGFESTGQLEDASAGSDES